MIALQCIPTCFIGFCCSVIMTMLEYIVGYEIHRSKKALDILLVDRNNEFRELAEVIFGNVKKSTNPCKDWEEFILSFCLDVKSAFKCWSGLKEMPPLADRQALTILRQLSRNKPMIQLTHFLNIAYNLGEEFDTIYRRLG